MNSLRVAAFLLVLALSVTSAARRRPGPRRQPMITTPSSKAPQSSNAAGTGLAPGQILVGTSFGVKSVSMASNHVTQVLNNSASSIAYDSTNKKIYFGSGYTIRRANLDGSGLETVHNSQTGQVQGLTLDESSGSLYVSTVIANFWTESYFLKCSTAATPLSCTEISKVSDFTYGAPGLNSKTGTLYYTTWSGEVRRVGTDGSNSQVIVNNLGAGVTQFRGAAVDSENSKLYWGDSSGAGKRIVRSDLDGKNVETLVKLQADSDPWNVAVGKDGRVYWANGYSANNVQSVDALGQDLRTHFTDIRDSSVYAVALVP